MLIKLKKAGIVKDFSLWKMLFCLLLLCFFYWFHSGVRPLATPDEGRYAEIPREMVATGDFITPRLNGLKYFEKPPLFYWAQAFAMKFFGYKEFAVRFFNILMAVLGVIGLYHAGKRLFSPRVGFISALLLATSLLYYTISRLILLDMTVSVLISGAIFSVLLSVQEPDRSKAKQNYLLLSYAFCGLATLTKGVIGFAIPGAVILLWIAATQQWSLIKQLLSFKGILLFFLITAPWHIAVSLKNPEFAWFYFIQEHFLRLTTRLHLRYQPFWFFVPVVILGLFPWIILFFKSCLLALKEIQQKKPLSSLLLALLIWVVLVFILFSLSQSKLIPYVLPLLPPAVLLLAYFLDQEWQKPAKTFSRAFFLHSLFSLGIAVALFFVPLPAHAQVPEVFLTIKVTSGIFAVGGIVAFFLARQKSVKAASYTLALQMMLALLLVNEVTPSLQRPSAKPAATFLLNYLQPEDHVASFKIYPQDLPYYLQRRIKPVEWRGELTFGASVEDARDWLIDSPRLKALAAESSRLFVLLRKKDFPEVKMLLEKSAYVVYEDKHYIVICNKELKA